MRAEPGRSSDRRKGPKRKRGNGNREIKRQAEGEHFYDVYFERTLISDLRWCLGGGDPQRGPGGPPLLPHLVLCMLESTVDFSKKKDPALSLLATQTE